MPRRPPTGQASLFETTLNNSVSSEAEIKRPYAHPQLFLGTSAFTANGWAGTFYPVGMKQGVGQGDHRQDRRSYPLGAATQTDRCGTETQAAIFVCE